MSSCLPPPLTFPWTTPLSPFKINARRGPCPACDRAPRSDSRRRRPHPLTFPWTTSLPLTDGVGGPTVQWWTEGEVLQRTLLHCPSSATSPCLLGIFLNTLRMFNVSPVDIFGDTYCCEQLFSKMKYTKYRLRSLFSDRHLNDILLLSSSSIEPDIEILLHGKQHQPSQWFATRALLRLESTMNLLEGGEGRVGERGWAGDGGRVGERGWGGRDDCYTYSNRYVQ